jgi:hypothetical protein
MNLSQSINFEIDWFVPKEFHFHNFNILFLIINCALMKLKGLHLFVVLKSTDRLKNYILFSFKTYDVCWNLTFYMCLYKHFKKNIYWETSYFILINFNLKEYSAVYLYSCFINGKLALSWLFWTLFHVGLLRIYSF